MLKVRFTVWETWKRLFPRDRHVCNIILLFFLIFGINNPKGFKKITLRNANKLEWPSVVLRGKAVMYKLH